MSHNGYIPLNEQSTRIGTVRNNNPFDPFSSNTVNPKQWGETPEGLKPAKDFVEMTFISLFFAGIYWSCALVLCLIKHLFATWISVTTTLLLVGSLVAAAAICFKRCELWYEYGALEYWQPVKDVLRAGIKRKGLYSLASGLAILLLTIVYGPFFVGAVAWVDELGQREHRD